ncbi:hypothetical protein [Phytobacter sp. V91]|uniref:hypothetical protein n=1 Tax=Phytobacter sp. V91 TaxID=3369425 RepID=UPI003F60BB32
MNNIKIITLFHANKNVPFMTCMVKDIEVNKHGIKFTLENGDSICVKDYDFFFVSESATDNDMNRMINGYGRLTVEINQVRKETISSPEPTTPSLRLLLLFLRKVRFNRWGSVESLSVLALP